MKKKRLKKVKGNTDEKLLEVVTSQSEPEQRPENYSETPPEERQEEERPLEPLSPEDRYFIRQTVNKSLYGISEPTIYTLGQKSLKERLNRV